MAVKQLVIGIFDTPSDLDEALDNLDEADFPPDTITVFLKDTTTKKTIFGDNPPYRIITQDTSDKKTTTTSLTDALTTVYEEQLLAGKSIVAVQALNESKKAAEEIMRSFNGKNIHSLQNS